MSIKLSLESRNYKFPFLQIGSFKIKKNQYSDLIKHRMCNMDDDFP